MKQRLSAPLIVDLNLTSKCNCKCLFCYANASFSQSNTFHEMPFEMVMNILGQLDDIGVNCVRLSGGEPFLHSRIGDILRGINDFSFSVCINTNGTILNSSILKLLQNAQISSVAVSLDSSIESKHNFLRGNLNAFALTTNNIKILAGELSENELSTTYTITRHNACPKEILETAELVASLGVSKMSLQIAAAVGRAKKNNDYVITPEQWDDIVIALTDYKKKSTAFPIRVNLMNECNCCWEYYFPLKKCNRLSDFTDIWHQDVSLTFETSRFISCVAGNYSIAITDQGQVFPCELMMAYPELCAGDIYTNSFRNIWENSQLLNKIHSIKMEELPHCCNTCELINCGGGCRATAYSMTKSLYSADLRCPKTHGENGNGE